MTSASERKGPKYVLIYIEGIWNLFTKETVRNTKSTFTQPIIILILTR